MGQMVWHGGSGLRFISPICDCVRYFGFGIDKVRFLLLYQKIMPRVTPKKGEQAALFHEN